MFMAELEGHYVNLEQVWYALIGVWRPLDETRS
jgi:hypothetical protein